MTTILFKWEQGGKTALNVFEVFDANSAILDDGDILVDAIETNVLPLLSVDTTFQGLEVLGAQPKFFPSGADGEASGAAASINTSFLIHKNPTSGRRGRFFLPGVREANLSPSGQILAANIGPMGAAWDNVQTVGIANNMSLGIKRQDDSVDQIVSFSVDPVAGTQRRRMRR